ncbi:MAG: class I SAM-dependent methyltransferase [Verrucomicrobia bacterium]|nr:class I SAM-dependent methyltransferase [Verrucomicrobiota bacterium]
MPNWMIKSAVQRVISGLPRSHAWNGLFQRYVTRGLDLGIGEFEAKLNACRKHFENYRHFSPRPRAGFRALELGTGWFPILPVGLHLCGASEIWTFDIAPLLRDFTFKQTLLLFCEYDQKGALHKFLPAARPERITNLHGSVARAAEQAPEALLKALNIHVLVRDARQTGLPSKSIDLVFSNVVLEHIPRAELADLFAEVRRVCADEAVISHYVGMADQYASFDRSITPFNFLKYPASRWRLLDNPIIPQNRLRISDYRSLLQEAGCSIVKELHTSGSTEALRQVKLAPEFRKYSQEDLLVLFAWIVARPNAIPKCSLVAEAEPIVPHAMPERAADIQSPASPR